METYTPTKKPEGTNIICPQRGAFALLDVLWKSAAFEIKVAHAAVVSKMNRPMVHALSEPESVDGREKVSPNPPDLVKVKARSAMQDMANIPTLRWMKIFHLGLVSNR